MRDENLSIRMRVERIVVRFGCQNDEENLSKERDVTTCFAFILFDFEERSACNDSIVYSSFSNFAISNRTEGSEDNGNVPQSVSIRIRILSSTKISMFFI